MNIRFATKDDIELISKLFTEFYAYNAIQQPKYYISAKESGEYPDTVINGENGDVIVAVVDDIIIGFIHIEAANTPPYPSVVSHQFACIVDFFVVEQHRKKGIGRLLLEEAKLWARSRQLEYLELMVLENNAGGRNFYERENFSTISQTMRLEI